MALLLILWAISLASSSHQSGRTHRESQPAAEPFYLYTYDQTVQLVNFDASQSTTIGQQTGSSKPVAVDYDPSRGYVFIVDRAARHITGSNDTHTLVVVTGLSKPRGLAFNWMNSTLFWTENKVIRYCHVDFDASVFCNPATLDVGPLDTPHAIAVDPQRGQLYWTESGQTPRISKLVQRGSGYAKKVLLSKRLFKPTSLSVEQSTGHVYWADPHVPALGCIGCQQNQHIFVKFSTRYEPSSVCVFDGHVYFYNRKRLNGELKFYSIPTTKWTHVPDSCSTGTCTTPVRPKPGLLLGSLDINVNDFLIINVTLQVPVTELPPSRAMTTEAIMFMTEHATDPRDSLDEPSSPQTKASPIPSQIPSRSPTETVEGNSDGFWARIHPGILAAAAVILCAVVLTIVLAAIVCRKQKANSGNKNNGFSSLDRPSPAVSVYEETTTVPASTVGNTIYDAVLPTTGIYDSCVPMDLDNPTYTGEVLPAVVSDHLCAKSEQSSNPFLVMRDATNMANPNYDAVIEIDQVSGQTGDSIHTSVPTLPHYDNVEQLQSPQYTEIAFPDGLSASQLPPSIYELPADQSSQSTTSKSTTSQYSQSGVSNCSSNAGYEPTFHLAVPQKPTCTQTI